MLGYTGTDGDGRLNASLERGGMYNDFVFPSLSAVRLMATSIIFSNITIDI